MVIKRADVADREAMAALLSEVQRDVAPLQGVLHAAVALEDGPLLEQNEDRFLKVCEPKMRGAWNLHELTKDLPLEYFVLYSSVSAWFGLVGQTAYAAANSYLDALAHYRRSIGLPGLSVNWSGISGAGVLARNARTCEFLENDFGLKLETPQQSLSLLGRLLQRDVPQAGAFEINWKLVRGFLAPALRDGLFSDLLRGYEQGGLRSADAAVLLSKLKSVSKEEARALMLEYLKLEVAKVLGVESSKLESDLPLSEIGMDSLMAFQLKVQLDAVLGTNLEPGRFGRVPSLDELAHSLVEAVELRECTQ